VTDNGDRVLADYVERLFSQAGLLTLAVVGHGRLIEARGLNLDSAYFSQLQVLAREVEFGLGMIHDRLTESEQIGA
jgi:hypothetical protein